MNHRRIRGQGSGEDAARRRRGLTTGGLVLWGGTVAFGASTALLLAVLSRNHREVGFAALSALLGLSFVMSLIPSGVQLRAAALIADGCGVPRMSARFLAGVSAVGVAFSPLLAAVLRVPILAVDLLVVQVVAALPLASRRGAAIGVHRFGALGVNMVVEGAIRVVLGVAGGLTFGITGLAGGLALATVAALVLLPTRAPNEEATPRPMTSLFNASITLVLLGFYVQMDVLMAPSGLPRVAATHYDLAAIPSKGVYIVLLAAGPLVFPFVRRESAHRLIVLAAAATLALGLVVTAALLPLRRLIGLLLGQHAPSFVILAALGAAMAMAGTTSVLLNAGVARGVRRPWPALVLGMVAVAACWAGRPPATTFAVTVLCAQAGTMLLSVWVCLRGRPAPITDLGGASGWLPIPEEFGKIVHDDDVGAFTDIVTKSRAQVGSKNVPGP